MNLSVLWELQKRLIAAAAAGVSLAPEDFRLKKAVEQMEPLAAASPVFRRIRDMAEGVTRSDCPDRPGLLLEALGLLEAVLKTQGSIGKPENGAFLEPLEPISCGAWIRPNLSYSRLAPLVEALEGEGRLRYAAVTEAYEETPEIFSDYRLKARMAGVLGDGYYEMADAMEQWLKAEGPQVVPLLKEGFRIDGGKETERRIRILGEVAGEEETDFFCKVISEGSKELRVTAIAMLKASEENAGLLLDLIRSERGKAKKAAMWALSFLDTEEAAGFWQKEADKNPKEAEELLRESSCDYVSDILAGLLRTYLEEKASGFAGLTKEEKKEKEAEEGRLLEAVKGKHSPALCACYPELYRLLPEEACDVLADSLLQEPHPGLFSLAKDLWEEKGGGFLEPFFLTSLLSDEPERVYEQFSGFFLPSRRKQRPEAENQADRLQKVLEKLKRDKKDGSLGFLCHKSPGLAGGPLTWYRRPVVLDERWNRLFLELPVKAAKREEGYDRLLGEWYRPGDREMDIRYGRYFYNRAMERGTRLADIRMLKACGWENFHGLIERAVKDGRPLPLWQMKQLLEEIPLAGPEKGGELGRLLQKQGKKGTGELRALENWRDELLQGFSLKN